MTITEQEIASQPDVWRRALDQVPDAIAALPPAGATALFMGCGTSAFVAQAAAWLREANAAGPTDWAYASEPPPSRPYEHVVAVTRSGTTTEVLDALSNRYHSARRVVITGVPGAVPDRLADAVLGLPFADEQSVVQTRFPTSVLILLRRVWGEDVAGVFDDAEHAQAMPLPVDPTEFDHFVFLGRRWTVGLAHEAALKVRESAQAWSESFPALDYRHGPIAVANRRTLVVSMGGVDQSLAADITASGATLLDVDLDPLARLVLCQRLAHRLAESRGLDPDAPRHLTRSVVLPARHLEETT